MRQSVDFANQILTMIENNGFDVGCIWFTDEAHFHCIWFTDEAHFHLNGFVSKQNWRFWGSDAYSFANKSAVCRMVLLIFVVGMFGFEIGACLLMTLYSFMPKKLIN